MKQVKAAYLEAGITVPSTHNEKGFRGQSWSTDYLDVGGSVNIYGLDSYAGGRMHIFQISSHALAANTEIYSRMRKS